MIEYFSQQFVPRTATALRRDPIDDFVRIHDVASLAMDAVGKIDLQAPPSVSVFDHLINGGGTEELAWVAVLIRAAWMTDIRLQDVEMAGLIFIVVRA